MWMQMGDWQTLVGRGPREAPMEWEGNIGWDLMAGEGWERWGYREEKHADASQCSGDKESSQRLEDNS